MKIHYNVTGQERKALVKKIEELTGEKSRYMGVPGCAYQIGACTIDKEGTMTTDGSMNASDLELLLETLCEQGYEADVEVPDEEQPSSTTVSMPRNIYNETSLDNLKKLVDSKSSLIKKALGVDELPVIVTEDTVSFPWLAGERSPEEVHAFMHLVSALGEAARNSKRITAKDKEVDNEKYAFRCFLLRLGFIGEESKTDRKILLRNLSGNSAFLSGHKPGTAAIPTPENTVKVDVEEAIERLQDPQVQAEIKAILTGEDGEQ